VLIMISIICVPPGLGKNRKQEFVHIILQSDGSTIELAEHVKSLGGIVKFRYRNVPAI